MKIYHITYAPSIAQAYLYFWGCNFRCKACLCLKEIYDCHLSETKDRLLEPPRKIASPPCNFLSLPQVLNYLEELKPRSVIFMGAEPSLDPELPLLARELHRRFDSHNIMLTNGFTLPFLDDIDEIVFSIKAVTRELHIDYTGQPVERVKENFSLVHRLGKKLLAESVLIPDYIGVTEIEKIARFISSVSPDIPYRIDPYIPVAANPWRRPLPTEMEEAMGVAGKYLSRVFCLRGDEELSFEVVRVF